jgi:EmrB/QacA subfamily drug resistance transporter
MVKLPSYRPGPAGRKAVSGEATPGTGLAMVVIMAGVLMTAVDTTIVVLALPEIERSLHVALTDVVWVIISFLLVITLLATQVGRLGDMFGRVRMYETGFAVFVVGSLLCALAWDETSIIVFRVVQGVGGALIMANSGAVIADLYPREQRGRAYGLTSVGWTVGAVLGIVLGGLIVTYVSWRWIFWINVPTGVLAIIGALRVLRDRGERIRQRLDPFGMLALGLGLFGVLWAITKLANAPFDASTLGFLVGGVAAIGVFVLIESRVAAPMLPLRIFKIPTMAASLCASLFQGLASFAVLFLVLMYLQGPRGLSPIHASLLLVPGYVVAAGVGLYAGRLADKRGPILPATLGLGIQAIALICYAQLTDSTPLALIVVISVINGIGTSMFFPANSSAIMKAAPQDMYGIASGMMRTFANIGMVFSFAVAILVASRSISRQLAFAVFVGSTSLHGSQAAEFTAGLHAAFYESVGFMVIAAILSALRGRGGRSLQPAAPDAVYRVIRWGEAELAGADLVQQRGGHAHDRRCQVLEADRVGGVGDVLRDFRAVEDPRQVGELAGQPAERVLRQFPQEDARARIPARGELRVVVRAVEAAGLAIHRLKQVHPPDRPARRDRDGRVDSALELAPVDDPQLKPDAVLGAFLPRVRVRVKEVQVTNDNADFLEDKSLQHLHHPPTSLTLPLRRAVDVDLSARGRDHLVEEARDVHRHPDAAVRGRPDRHVRVTVDGELRADEEHRVVHLAKRHLDPAGQVDRRVEGAVGGDRLRAPVAAAVVVVAAAAGDVADQPDPVVLEQHQHLECLAHLHAGGELALVGRRLVRPGVHKRALGGRVDHAAHLDAVDLLECPDGRERVSAKVAVDRAGVVLERGEPPLQRLDVGACHALGQVALGRGKGGGRRRARGYRPGVGRRCRGLGDGRPRRRRRGSRRAHGHRDRYYRQRGRAYLCQPAAVRQRTHVSHVPHGSIILP